MQYNCPICRQVCATKSTQEYHVLQAVSTCCPLHTKLNIHLIRQHQPPQCAVINYHTFTSLPREKHHTGDSIDMYITTAPADMPLKFSQGSRSVKSSNSNPEQSSRWITQMNFLTRRESSWGKFACHATGRNTGAWGQVKSSHWFLTTASNQQPAPTSKNNRQKWTTNKNRGQPQAGLDNNQHPSAATTNTDRHHQQKQQPWKAIRHDILAPGPIGRREAAIDGFGATSSMPFPRAGHCSIQLLTLGRAHAARLLRQPSQLNQLQHCLNIMNHKSSVKPYVTHNSNFN